MSQSAAQSSSFYFEVSANSIFWTLKDEKGFPSPENNEGKRVMPFWSSKSRVQKIIANVKAYSSFEPYQISLNDFLQKWIPGLTKDDLLVGINWSGKHATGYDVLPVDVEKNIRFYLSK